MIIESSTLDSDSKAFETKRMLLSNIQRKTPLSYYPSVLCLDESLIGLNLPLKVVFHLNGVSLTI